MKATEEIYSVRFNKAVLRDGDIHFQSYTIGVPIYNYASLSPLIPESIILKAEKITVTFNDKTKHIIGYTQDVEIFIREKQKTKTDEEISVDSKD